MAELIQSKTNPKIKQIAKLVSSAKERKKQGQFVLEGLRLCQDAMQSGIRFSMLVYTKAALNKSGEIIELLEKNSEFSFVATEDVFEKISDTVSPQGVICVADMPKENDYALNKNGKYIVLNNLSNPDNIGAISRTAEAFGVDALIVIGGCDIYNPKALRSSMGALIRLSVLNFTEDDFFDFCLKNGIKTFASTPRKDALPLDECNFESATAVLIGNEANGLDDSIIAKCDSTVTIKMNGKAESLNAAAAAAVLIYEMTKQR